MNQVNKKILKTGIVLSLLTSTLLHATNGDNLIGVGTKARGMGGAGIGISHCAESTLQNLAPCGCLCRCLAHYPRSPKPRRKILDGQNCQGAHPKSDYHRRQKAALFFTSFPKGDCL